MPVSDRIRAFLAIPEHEDSTSVVSAPMVPNPEQWDFIIVNISCKMASALASELDLNIDYLSERSWRGSDLEDGLAIKDGAICYITSGVYSINQLTFNELLEVLDKIEARKNQRT